MVFIAINLEHKFKETNDAVAILSIFAWDLD